MRKISVPVFEWLMIVGVVAAGCFLGIIFLQADGTGISAMWPTSGIAVAVLVRFGRAALIPVIAGHLVIWFHIAPSAATWPVLLVPLTYTLEAYLISLWDHRRNVGEQGIRSEMWTVVRGYFVVPVICGIVLAIVTIWSFSMVGRFDPGVMGPAVIQMTMAHVHGLIAFGGLCFHIFQQDFNWDELSRSRSGAAAGAGAVILMACAFTGAMDGTLSPFFAIFLPLPLLVIAAVKLPPSGMSVVIAAWCLTSTLCLSAGHSPFGVVSEGWWVGSKSQLVLYNILMSSVGYLISVGVLRMQRQLDLNEVALNAAGIDVWEWNSSEGFHWIRADERRTRDRGNPGGILHHEELLKRFAGVGMGDGTVPDNWRCRFNDGLDDSGQAGSRRLLESAGKVLQRRLDGRPTKAIGLLQDVSAHQRADEALVALGYQKAKLRSLQAKLAPHFLFNSLNIIHALVHIDPRRADVAITSLAGLLRSNLRSSDRQLVELHEELRHIRELLVLARLRFGPRIKTRLRVPASLMQLQVPPMLILNLVENAITHGIGNSEKGGAVDVSADVIEQQVKIMVKNTGYLPENADRGLGIQDAVQRLEILYAGRARFSLSQTSPETVSAVILLPYSIPQL